MKKLSLIISLTVFSLLFSFPAKAASYKTVTYREHATDCTSLTAGKSGHYCWELDSNVIYKCIPSVGACDTPGEWIVADFIATEIDPTVDTSAEIVAILGADSIPDTLPDFGIGADQISASDMPDEDIGDITIVSSVYTVDAGAIHDLTVHVKEENTGAIVKGQAVYVSGSAGAGQVLVGLINNTDSTKIRVLGLAAEAIAQNTTGTVRFRGELSGVDTLGANVVNPNGETWAAGDILYCTNGGSGGLTNIKPTSGRIIRAGYSLVGSHNDDTILVQPHENPICLATASDEDICVRMGDNNGVNKVCFKDYANNDVACVDSNGIYTCTGLTIGSAAILEAELEILDGATLGTADINIIDGISDSGSLTATELLYVDGVTSAIQGQIDAKAPTDSPTFTTEANVPTPAANDNDTSVATTAFVQGEIGSAYYNIPIRIQGAGLDSTNPAIIDWISSSGTGTPKFPRLKFDDGDDDTAYFTVYVPDSIGAGSWYTDVSTYSDEDVNENVIYATQISCTSDNDVDNMEEQAAGVADTCTANFDKTEAKARETCSIEMDSGSYDSVVAGDECVIIFYRDGDNGSDNHTNESYVTALNVRIPRN